MNKRIFPIFALFLVILLISATLVSGQDTGTETETPTMTITVAPPSPSPISTLLLTQTPVLPTSTQSLPTYTDTPPSLPSPTPVSTETPDSPPPASTPMPTETSVPPTSTQTLPVYTATPISILSPTPSIVLTETPTILDTVTAQPSQTLDVPTTTATPVSLTSLPTAMPYPLTVPYTADMDDGAPDWFPAGNWYLETAANSDPDDTTGLGWIAVANGNQAVLQLLLPLDIHGTITPVISFNTIMIDPDQTAVIETSLDGESWTVLAQLPQISNWTALTFDLTVYSEHSIWLRFRWYAQPPADSDIPLPYWSIDDVTVTDLGPTLSAFCPADIDRDGILTPDDLVIISRSPVYGTTPDIEFWNPVLDFNVDNLIDVLDLQMAAQAIGESCITNE